MNLEHLQKEARESFYGLFLGYYEEGETYKDAAKYADKEMEKLNELITHVYKQAVEETISLAKEHAHSIKKADKTPRYSYSNNKNARNADGELPNGGRWKNCGELADDLVHNLQTLLSKQ